MEEYSKAMAVIREFCVVVRLVIQILYDAVAYMKFNRKTSVHILCMIHMKVITGLSVAECCAGSNISWLVYHKNIISMGVSFPNSLDHSCHYQMSS